MIQRGDIVRLKPHPAGSYNRHWLAQNRHYFDEQQECAVLSIDGGNLIRISILRSIVFESDLELVPGEKWTDLNSDIPEDRAKLRKLGMFAGKYVIHIPEDHEEYPNLGLMNGKIVTVQHGIDYAGWGMAPEDNLLTVALENPIGRFRELDVPETCLLPLDDFPPDYMEPEKMIYRFSCERCGTKYWISEEEAEGDLPPEDANLCPACRRRRYVLPYHRQYPPLDFWKEKTDDNLFLGAEIEIDDGGENDSTAGKIVDMMNPKGRWFMYCSHDGSLFNGMELITSPATLAVHKKKKAEYEKLFSYLRSHGYRAHNTSTCGLHVHFSREFFGEGAEEEANVCKLLYVVERFWKEIVIFSRRDYRTLERYAKKTGGDAKTFYKRWNKSGNHDGHYYSVNISNENTIEFRMFRGTLNLKTYMAVLSFVDHLVRTIKDKSIEELQRMSFEDLLSREAKAYYRHRVSMLEYDETQIEPDPETIQSDQLTTRSGITFDILADEVHDLMF